MHVSENSIIACVGSIYQAAYDPTFWPNVVESLRGLLDGSTACLVRMGPERRPGDLIAPNNDPAFQDRYIAEFVDEPNIVESAIARAPVGSVYSDLGFIGTETLRASRLWNDWMAPQDMYGGLTCKLTASGQSSWFFDVQRGRRQPAFDDVDLELLKTIAQHLARALDIGRHARIAQLVSSGLSHLPFAVIAVDARLRVLVQNEAAERILSDHHSGLFLRRGALVTSDFRNNIKLQRLVAESCATRPGALPGLGGDLLIVPGLQSNDPATLAISVGPSMGGDGPAIVLEPSAVIIVRRISQEMPVGFAEAIARFFDLTPQEARVAAALTSGQPLKTVADQAGIRLSTARSHLARVFDKTSTSQQSQLVAMLKNVQAALPHQ